MLISHYLYKTKKLENFHDLIRKNLSNLETNPNLKFHDLEWRYDLQIASRSCQDETKPRIFLNLKLSKCNNYFLHLFFVF